MARTGPETRALLVESALRLFREQGFADTTMRAIAADAGVSLGNAYHYFTGKDELVQELYLSIQQEHQAIAAPQLIAGSPLADNLRIVLHTGIDVIEPYHSFGQSFVRTALPPASAASPFSGESARSRDLAMDLMRRVVAESGTRVPARLADRLPMLLWLVYLGVTLHWVTDTTPERRRTRTLIDGTGPIVGRAVALSGLPVARSLTNEIINLLDAVTSPQTPETT